MLGFTRIFATLRGRAAGVITPLGSDRGEGVISAAIAVLIIALLGAAMWVAFSGMMEGATGRIETSVESIG